MLDLISCGTLKASAHRHPTAPLLLGKPRNEGGDPGSASRNLAQLASQVIRVPVLLKCGTVSSVSELCECGGNSGGFVSSEGFEGRTSDEPVRRPRAVRSCAC